MYDIQNCRTHILIKRPQLSSETYYALLFESLMIATSHASVKQKSIKQCRPLIIVKTHVQVFYSVQVTRKALRLATAGNFRVIIKFIVL